MALLLEARLRKKRHPETQEQRTDRFVKEAQRRIEDAAAEDKAIDAMVKRNIEARGP